jgi:hypothetical protein
MVSSINFISIANSDSKTRVRPVNMSSNYIDSGINDIYDTGLSRIKHSKPGSKTKVKHFRRQADYYK